MGERESPTEEVDALARDIFLGALRVLHHAATGPIYGVEMIEALNRHDYWIGLGTMYPTLHALREKGYLALLAQHQADHTLTAEIRRLSQPDAFADAVHQEQVVVACQRFIPMYCAS